MESPVNQAANTIVTGIDSNRNNSNNSSNSNNSRLLHNLVRSLSANIAKIAETEVAGRTLRNQKVTPKRVHPSQSRNTNE